MVVAVANSGYLLPKIFEKTLISFRHSRRPEEGKMKGCDVTGTLFTKKNLPIVRG